MSKGKSDLTPLPGDERRHTPDTEEIQALLLDNVRPFPEDRVSTAGREELRAALVETESLLSHFSEMAGVGLWVLRGETIVYVNQGMCEKLSATSKDFIGTSYLGFFDAEEQRRLLKYLNPEKMSGTDFGVIEASMPLPGGGRFPVEIKAREILYLDSPAVAMMLRDITHEKQAFAAMAETEARFRHLVEMSPHAIAVIVDDKIALINSKWVDILGAASKKELLGRPASDFLHIDHIEQLRDLLQEREQNSGPGRFIEQQIVRLDGTVNNIEVTIAPLTFQGKPGFQVIGREITPEPLSACIDTGEDLEDVVAERTTALKRAYEILQRHYSQRLKAENDLRESQRAMTTLLSNLPGMAYRCPGDHAWTMEFVSEGSLELTGFEPAMLINNKEVAYVQLIHRDDLEMVWQQVKKALKHKEPFRLIYRIATRSGQEKWLWEQGRGVYSDSGELTAIEGFIADVTTRKLAEEKLRLAAIQDATTGLYSRGHFMETVEEQIEKARENQQPLSLCLVDLDRFKQINDQFGHKAGDMVLGRVGKLIRNKLRAEDIAGRIGGDEICILFPGTRDVDARECMERIRLHLQKILFHPQEGVTFHVTITCGIARLRSEHIKVRDLMDEADMAMYQAKTEGRNRTVVYR